MKIEITQKSLKLDGTAPELLSGLSMLIRGLKGNIPEEMIKHAIELGFKSDEEINKQVEDVLEKKTEKLFELLGKLGIDIEED